jgi:hypothetical protein|nr:MAG TPA: hypothetical protein [Caudoviricetes sp.]
MKCYKLLKDLPTFKAGQLAYTSELGNLIAGTPEKPKTTNDGRTLMIYHKTTLNKFPEILTEWFEEIEEQADSIHWKPEYKDKYWYIRVDGGISHTRWADWESDISQYEFGSIYHTYEEARKVRDRRLAEVRLRRASTFKPDFENGKGGYCIGYDYLAKTLRIYPASYIDAGEPVRYETEEDAQKFIEENEEDWLIYFGIKEEK